MLDATALGLNLDIELEASGMTNNAVRSGTLMHDMHRTDMVILRHAGNMIRHLTQTDVANGYVPGQRRGCDERRGER